MPLPQGIFCFLLQTSQEQIRTTDALAKLFMSIHVMSCRSCRPLVSIMMCSLKRKEDIVTVCWCGNPVCWWTITEHGMHWIHIVKGSTYFERSIEVRLVQAWGMLSLARPVEKKAERSRSTCIASWNSYNPPTRKDVGLRTVVLGN